MPHKRAKLATRRARQADTGVNLAPQESARDMPRSAMAVFRAPKPAPREAREARAAPTPPADSDLRIRPGEKISAFNRCVPR